MHTHTNSEGVETASKADLTSARYCLNANLRKACRVLAGLYTDEMRGSGLQGTQFTLLSTVSGFGEVTISELGNFLAMDQTTVTRAVQLLRKAEYLEVASSEDRRRRIVRLTGKGRDVLDAAYPRWLEAQTRVWEELGEAKALQLLRLTEEIAALGRGG